MKQWRDIFEAIPEAIVVLSRSGEPLAVNAAGENLLEASQITRGLIEQLHARNEWIAQMIATCFRTGQNLDTPDGVLRLAKRSVSVRAQVSPILERRGAVARVILMLHDLSSQHGMERATDPERQVMRLSPAGLAHELKNPLTGIKGAAELIAGLFAENPKARQYCEVILHGVNRITSLIEQVLSASAPGRLKREPLNIHQVLHQALRSAALFEPIKGLHIEQVFDPSLPEVMGDAEALERVFVNLLKNATEAMQAGADGRNQTIRLRTSIEAQFRFSANGRRRQFLRIEVSDSGKGMSAEELEQLFAPFFTTKAEGTGLGLVLSQRTIALHGGKLWAESRGIEMPSARRGDASNDPQTDAPQAPRGMTFCVILPFGPE